VVGIELIEDIIFAVRTLHHRLILKKLEPHEFLNQPDNQDSREQQFSNQYLGR
jgi:hypothetical protein